MGPKCNVFDSNVSSQEQVRMMNVIANQSLAMLKAQETDNPLCKQGNECAGWGAIERGQGALPGKYPIITLTYGSDSPPSVGGKRCPKEVTCTDYDPPRFGIDGPEVLSSMDVFETYVHNHFTAAPDGQEGTNGIFGNSFEDVFTEHYSHGGGITVISAHLPQAVLSLRRDPSTNNYIYTLDKFAMRAISALPPPPIGLSESGINEWYRKHHDLFHTFFENYGTSLVVDKVLIGGLVEMVSEFKDTSISSTKLKDDTFNDFHRLTGLVPSHSGAHDANLTNKLICYGGDATKCTEEGIAGGDWPESTSEQSVLLSYVIADIEEFLKDLSNNISLSVSTARKAYIREIETRVTWTWNQQGIGGNCNATSTEGSIQLPPGTTQITSSCYNGCNVSLSCMKALDGTLTAVHKGCGNDTYTGSPVTVGCSIVAPFGKKDSRAGQCCMY